MQTTAVAAGTAGDTGCPTPETLRVSVVSTPYSRFYHLQNRLLDKNWSRITRPITLSMFQQLY